MPKKRINTHAKGVKNEKEFMDILVKAGWKVYKPVWNKWANKDIFNLFDMCCLKQKTKFWVQVKTNRMDNVQWKLMKEWLKEFGNSHDYIGMAVRYDDKPKAERWKITRKRGNDEVVEAIQNVN